MAEQFDPYRKWLGIPPEEQPANFYRLLGVPLFETDVDVISNAADRQMAHIRTFQTGRYANFSQRLLNELSAARLCLLDKNKHAQYDDMLRNMGYGAVSAPPATAPTAAAYPAQAGYPPNDYAAQLPTGYDNPVPTEDDPLGLRSGPSRRKVLVRKQSSSLPWIIGGIALIAILVAGALVVNNMNQAAVEANNPPAPTTPPKKPVEKDDKTKDDKTKDKPKTDVKPSTDPKKPDPGSDKSKPQDSGTKPAEPPKQPTDVAPKQPDPAPKSRPESPKFAEGEMPDYGPLPVLAANDPAINPTALSIPDATVTDPIYEKLRPEWKSALSKAHSRSDKRKLAHSLFDRAQDAKDDRPRQYVLFKAACDLATQIADAETFVKAINELATGYIVDGYEAQSQAYLNASSVSMKDDEYKHFLSNADHSISAASAAERYDAAEKIAHVAASMARGRGENGPAKKFERTAGHIEEMVKDRDKATKAAGVLAKQPEDRQANLDYGVYTAFVRGDWRKGSAYLEKVEDAEIKQAAQFETAASKAPEKEMHAGEAWFTVAKKYHGMLRTKVLKRSKYWYEQALAGFGGKTGSEDLSKEADARLREIDELLK